MIAFELLLTVPFFGIMGVLAFIVAYGLVFGDADIGFSGVRTIAGLLLGMPIAGIVSGWLAARWYSARARGQ